MGGAALLRMVGSRDGLRAAPSITLQNHMTQPRNGPAAGSNGGGGPAIRRAGGGDPLGGGTAVGTRSLSARSVVASVLLGTSPPRLPTRLLVSAGQLFGIAEGTTRVALSRMVGAGELAPDGDGYRLVGPLLDRQARQAASRQAERRSWTGEWEMAVVEPGSRTAGERSALREAMRQLHLAELREGVWLRPDNLAPTRLPEAAAVVAAQCVRFRSRPGGGDAALAADLWDLGAWADEARRLQADLAGLVGPLEAGRTEPLAPGFVVSAAVLRHLLADPLLPDALLPTGWPGTDLRRDYDRMDVAYQAVLRAWFRTQR